MEIFCTYIVIKFKNYVCVRCNCYFKIFKDRYIYFYTQTKLIFVKKAQYHPRNDRMFLVCPLRHAAVIVDIDGKHHVVPLDDDVSKKKNFFLKDYIIKIHMNSVDG